MKRIHLLQILLLCGWLFVSDAMIRWMNYRVGRTYIMHPYLGVEVLVYFLLGVIISLPMLKMRGKFRPQPWLVGLSALLFVALLPFWSGLLPGLLIAPQGMLGANTWLNFYRCLSLLMGVALPLGLFYPRRESPAPETVEADGAGKE